MIRVISFDADVTDAQLGLHRTWTVDEMHGSRRAGRIRHLVRLCSGSHPVAECLSYEIVARCRINVTNENYGGSVRLIPLRMKALHVLDSQRRNVRFITVRRSLICRPGCEDETDGHVICERARIR